MANEIKFSCETVSIGRNGSIRTTGLDVTNSYDVAIELSPINSRGGISNCSIQIPKADIPKLIEALQLVIK